MSSTGGRPPCAACTRFYRRCTPWCVFAPYFPPDNPGRFAAVHSAFRASYVAELLRELPLGRRAHAVDLLADRALALGGRRQNTRQLKAALDAVREQVGTRASPSRAVSSSPSCAACEKLRRGCTPECVFAPHFPPGDDPGRLADVDEAFGGENVARILGDLPPDQRRHAVSSLVYAARARLRDPVHGRVAAVPALNARMQQVRDQCSAAEDELMRQAWAGADPGTVAALHEKIMEKMARETAHAKQLAAFVEVASREPAAGTHAAPAEAAPSLIQQQPPSQEQTATATLKADDRDGDPSPPQWSAWAAAATPVVLVDAQQLAAARQQSRMARQAKAVAHARPTGSSSGVAVAILPPASAEAAPSLIQHQPPSQGQTEVPTVGVRDPGLPNADDQGGETSRGSV